MAFRSRAKLFERRTSFLDRLRGRQGGNVMKVKTKNGEIKEINGNGVVVGGGFRDVDNSRNHKQVSRNWHYTKYSSNILTNFYFLDVWKFWVLKSAWEGHFWKSYSMSGKVFKSSLCHQDPQEGSHYQERWSRAHYDRKQGSPVDKASFPHSKWYNIIFVEKTCKRQSKVIFSKSQPFWFGGNVNYGRFLVSILCTLMIIGHGIFGIPFLAFLLTDKWM